MQADKKKLLLFIVIFAAVYLLPVERHRVQTALIDAFMMLSAYARKHVLFCLVPAFFIAGAIAVFLGKGSVMRYFGPRANKVLSYSVASVSGTILAVCSCTVLSRLPNRSRKRPSSKNQHQRGGLCARGGHGTQG